MAIYSHFYRVAQDLQGNAVMGVMGTITLAGTATPATLYADPEGLTPLPNPLANDAQYGSFSVYLGSGHYDMTFAKEGYVFEPLEDILIADASGGVIALVGTPNQVIVSSSFGNVVLSTPQNTDPDATIQFAHLGLGTPGIGSHGLVVETYSDFRNTMAARTINSAADVTARRFIVADYPGDNVAVFYSNLTAGTNRWALLMDGGAASYLGGQLQVIGAVTFNSTFNVASNVGIGGSLAVTGSVTSPVWAGFAGGISAGTQSAPASPRKLDVWGDAYVSSHSGLGVAPLPGQYHVNAGSVQATALRVTNWVDVNTTLVVYGQTTTSGLYNNGTLTANGPLVGNTTLVVYGQTTTSGLYNNGTLTANGPLVGNTTLTISSGPNYIAGITGIGRSPSASWSLCVVSLWADGNAEVQNLTSRVGIACANLTASNNMTTPTITATTGMATGALTATGNINAANVIVSSGISCLNITTTNAYKPGGGPWADTSSRALKRQIAPISDALGLLLEQRGRVYEWDEPWHAAALPGPRYGLVADEVTIPQWHTTTPEGDHALALQGFEALVIESLRAIVIRLEALGG